MKYPCREKYIDETMGGIWFQFGVHGDGTVDIANLHGDVLTQVPPDKAKRIIAAQNELMKLIYEELCLK